jgi:hypothetical protein
MYGPAPTDAPRVISSRRDADDLVRLLVAQSPPGPHTYVVPLDPSGQGGLVVTVEHGGGYAEPLYLVAEFAGRLAIELPHVTSVLLATSGTDATHPPSPAAARRLFEELELLVGEAGIELADVLATDGTEVSSLREAAGYAGWWHWVTPSL